MNKENKEGMQKLVSATMKQLQTSSVQWGKTIISAMKQRLRQIKCNEAIRRKCKNFPETKYIMHMFYSQTWVLTFLMCRDDDDDWLQAKAPLHLNLFYKASTFNPLGSLSSTDDINTTTIKGKLQCVCRELVIFIEKYKAILQTVNRTV